jgi:hypothetical protein
VKTHAADDARVSRFLGLAGQICRTLFSVAVAVGQAFGGELFISELFFNPPGVDAPNEYIEIRGTPNRILPEGTFLLAVEGDAGSNPGVVQNVFNLSGKTIGGNGFIVLLQNGYFYAPEYSASVYVNTNAGPGWGSGAGSVVGHFGNKSITDLKSPSVTFLLVRSTDPIAPGDDSDSNDDGLLDNARISNWIIEDAVGICDSDGAGDIVYGFVNFRSSTSPGNGATASGIVIPVPFTPRYVARNGNSTNWAPSAWVASDVTGSVPNWNLGPVGNTYPGTFGGFSLNHLGAPNFGAPGIPGIVVIPEPGGIQVTEGGGIASFSLALNTPPSGSITLEVFSDPALQISTNEGASYQTDVSLVFTDTNRQMVSVRATDDEVLNISPRWLTLGTRLLASGDLVHYPLTSLTPQIAVGVSENDFVLFNEVNVNPPGTNDAPYEYIELRGTPRALLRNVQLLVLDGESNPGKVLFQSDLAGQRLGSDGFLLVASTNAGFVPATSDGFYAEAQFNNPGGALPNGVFTLLLLNGSGSMLPGQDLDPSDEGELTGLPKGTSILDSLAFTKDKGVCYSPARLQLETGLPDAAGRLSNNLEPNSPSAWVNGELEGTNPASLFYADKSGDGQVPAGTRLTPGYGNNTAPRMVAPAAISGVIGDPTNPRVLLSVSDAETVAPLTLWLESSNPAVAARTNLSLILLSNNTYHLSIDPVGVGYSEISVLSADGGATGRTAIGYAASAPGRPGGIWHLGASDGSAGVPVDSDYFWLADDENQILRLYPRKESSLPLKQLDLTPFLDLPDVSSGMPREVDFEASTRTGDLLLWIGSHGHSALGEPRTNRTRLVATRLEGTGAPSMLSYVGRYDFLKEDLIDWDKQNRHGKGAGYYGLEASDADGVPPKAPDGSGLAIEGLTMIPGETNAGYIAFRAPIVPATNRTFALIIPVLNLVSLAAGGGPPGSTIFGNPIELDLYGRGVRSIEGDSNGFVIVGGPAGAATGSYPKDFRLYTWNGDSEKNAEQRAADVSDLNPEGIVSLPETPWSDESEIEVVSDNGTSVFYGDGIPAKDLSVRNFKKSRSDRIKLGAATKPAPIIVSVALSEFSLGITWRSLNGEIYRLQRTTDLTANSWQDVPGDVLAVGPFARKEIPESERFGFFRVMVSALSGL